MEQIMRGYQLEAVESVLTALNNKQQKILVEMISGTGLAYVLSNVLVELFKLSEKDNLIIVVSNNSDAAHVRTIFDDALSIARVSDCSSHDLNIIICNKLNFDQTMLKRFGGDTRLVK